MKKYLGNIRELRLFSALFAMVVCFLIISFWVLPFGFFGIWLFLNLDTAIHYIMPLTVVISSSAVILVSFLISSLKIERIFSIIAPLFFAIIYFTVFSDFVFKDTWSTEPKKEMTEAERKRIELNIECGDIGYSYARSFLDPSRGDMIIPVKCRGLDSTRRGIILGLK